MSRCILYIEMELVDTHCHLDFSEFSHDREQVIDAARNANVDTIIIPAVKRSTWDSLIELCSTSECLQYALGLHPLFIADHVQAHVDDLGRYLKNSNPVAIGEIGLDFYDQSLDRAIQIDLFERQLHVAKRERLPVILHVRKAHDDVIKMLQRVSLIGGIVHAFNGSMQQAIKYQELNFKFGFGGMLTFERSAKLRKLAKELPLETIVLETDAPDMTVSQYRGERNSPEYLPFCLQALAEVKSLDIEIVAARTTQNAREVLFLT